MRSTWQGKAGRSPLQALYESDQVREQEGEDGGGWKGSEVLEVDSFFHPSDVGGTVLSATIPNTLYESDQIREQEDEDGGDGEAVRC